MKLCNDTQTSENGKSFNPFESQERQKASVVPFIINNQSFPDDLAREFIMFLNKTDIQNFKLVCKNWHAFFKLSLNNLKVLHFVDIRKFYKDAPLEMIKNFIKIDLTIDKNLKVIFLYLNQNGQRREILDFIYDLFKNEYYSGQELHSNLFPWAVVCNKIAEVKNFIEHGIDINKFDPVWGQPLTIASAYGYTDLVKLLLSQPEISVSLHQKQYDKIPHTHLLSPLQFAAYYGHEEVVIMLLDHSADINYWGGNTHNALHYAISNGHLNVVKILLKKGSNYTQHLTHEEPFFTAAKNGHLEIFQELHKYFPTYFEENRNRRDYNSSYTPFHVAIISRHYHVAEYLLASGVSINTEAPLTNSPYGTSVTALYYAIDFHAVDIVEWLIKKGADLDAVKSNESLCMRLFTNQAIRCKPKSLEYLLKLGLDINSKDKAGSTALHMIVENLIKVINNSDSSKFDVQLRNYYQDENRFLSAVKLLIHYGANPHIPRGPNADKVNLTNRTAFQIAFHHKCISLLEIFVTDSIKLDPIKLECAKKEFPQEDEDEAYRNVLKAEQLLIKNKDLRYHYLHTNWYRFLEIAKKQSPQYFEEYISQVLNGQRKKIYTPNKFKKFISLEIVKETTDPDNQVLLVDLAEKGTCNLDKFKILKLLYSAREKFMVRNDLYALAAIDEKLLNYTCSEMNIFY